MKKPSRLDYAYAVGRVRVLEGRLISKPIFSEAAEEKDFPSAIKIIFDAGDFLDEMVEIQSSRELDEFIEREEESLFKLTSEILIEKEILKIIVEENQVENSLAVAESINYPFIKDYLRHKIDLGNLKIFCRVKYSGVPKEKFERLILKGGFLDEKILLQSFDLSFAEVGDKLYATPYQDVWNKAADAIQERETFIELERGFEDFLMIYLRKAKYITFGPEPVFAYALAKQRELSLVRLLGVGKLNRIPTEILKNRISETYV